MIGGGAFCVRCAICECVLNVSALSADVLGAGVPRAGRGDARLLRGRARRLASACDLAARLPQCGFFMGFFVHRLIFRALDACDLLLALAAPFRLCTV